MKKLSIIKSDDAKPAKLSSKKLQAIIDKQAKENFYLKSIINKLPGSIYWKDREGVYLGCNDFVLDMVETNNIIGKTDYDLPWKEQAPQICAIDKTVIETCMPLELEENPTLADGQQIIMLTRKAPLKDELGNTIGIIGISVDITERKKLEEALKEAKEKAEIANKAKTDFLENMRHDIRTPLTGIMGFANIIGDSIDDPKIKEYVDNLTASSYALLDLLNEILEVIKLNSGEIPIVKKKFDLEKRIFDVIRLNQARAQHKHLELIFDYDHRIPSYVIGDYTRIHRIALELITNALNFTESGSVKLSIKLSKNNKRDLVIKLIVEDTGIGIEANKQQEIFLQFKRLTPSYEGIYKGAGLGLTIVKQFIDELDGEIYVESKIDVGTKFTCVIPLKKPLLDEKFGSAEEPLSTGNKDKIYYADEKIHKNEIINNKSEKTKETKNKILVVEDNSLVAIVLTNMLSNLNCQVDVAIDGEEAIKLAKGNNYDLIFMDIGLPKIDGYEATKRIRLFELNKGTHIPIIALTAHVDDENKQRCIDVGMNAVLEKPLVESKAEDILNAFIPYRKQVKIVEGGIEPKEKFDLFKLEGKIIDFEFATKQMGSEKSASKMIKMEPVILSV